VHEPRHRDAARRLAAQGQSSAAIARRLHLPQTTVYRWIVRQPPPDTCRPTPCPRCGVRSLCKAERHAYAYLLGQYLGDGHLVAMTRVPVLRIYACSDYPDVTDEVARAVVLVRGSTPARMRVAGSARVTKVQSYWKHWP
jgi:hypothetical protein